LYSHGAGVEVLDYLADLGVSLMSLANNHAWDYGAEGVLSTIAEVEARGFTYAGTGANISVATAPAYLMAGELSVALIAAASVRWPDVVRATENRAGVNILKPGDDADRERNLAGIRLAKETADIVIAYHHFQTGAVEGWQEAWARAAIDAGANIYVSHGEPRLAGVEVYQGGLILYGLGNFIFHTRTEPGHYPTDVWESVIAEVVLDELGVAEVSFVPIVLNPGTEGPLFLETRGYPEVADGETGAAILKRLLDLSARYGTMIELDAGKATLRLGQPK
jgi:poly-gamma-glutamate synthesis protein (capsule biosynthesis protein)